MTEVEERKLREALVDHRLTIDRLQKTVLEQTRAIGFRDAMITILAKQIIAFKLKLGIEITEEEKKILEQFKGDKNGSNTVDNGSD